MKLIIAGGRDYSPKREHISLLRSYLVAREVTEILSGCANGADLVGELVAGFEGIPTNKFPANWKLHGKSAGPIRNAEMAKIGDALFAFPGGSGTADMVKKMQELNKPVFFAEG